MGSSNIYAIEQRRILRKIDRLKRTQQNAKKRYDIREIKIRNLKMILESSMTPKQKKRRDKSVELEKKKKKDKRGKWVKDEV